MFVTYINVDVNSVSLKLESKVHKTDFGYTVHLERFTGISAYFNTSINKAQINRSFQRDSHGFCGKCCIIGSKGKEK